MTESPQPPLRVCILAHQCHQAGGLSVGRNVLRALGRVAPQHQYLATVPAGRGYEEICQTFPACRAWVYPRKGGLVRRWLDETLLLPKVVGQFEPDVIVGLGDRGLDRPPCPQAIYFHRPTLIHSSTHCPDESMRERILRHYHRRYLGKCLKRCQLVFCQTPITAQRLRRWYTFDGDIVIRPPAVSPILLEPPNAAGPMPKAFEPHRGDFRLLCLARYYTHKNHQAIVECFRRYRRELQGVVVFITVTPDQHRAAGGLLDRIRRLGLSDSIISLGQIPHAEVRDYYAHCHATLMPTLLESFSITYLEAMSFQTPIITSDLDFAHAACGDAAIYCDPWDPASIRDAILKLKSAPELAAQLVQRGRTRLATIGGTWDDVATEMIEHLRRIAAARA